MKRIILLGSTGSIGLNTLQLVRENPDEFRITALAARSNAGLLRQQIEEFKPEAVSLWDESAARELAAQAPKGTRVLTGADGLRELAAWKNGDIVVAATSGVSSLVPVLAAIEAGKDIALANKELLVMAGRLVTEAVQKRGVRLLPVDSEHNAVFQCLEGSDRSDVRRIILTGSGGPLKDIPASKFRGISKETVINHPKWSMGKKISVDSATQMNKGLETIEALWLFGVEPEKIKILIHPEAVVHSMVEFTDGSVIAQMGPTDMKSPLLHVLGYPRRIQTRTSIRLETIGALHFSEPDPAKFPCLQLAAEAARQKDTTLPCVLSAADEVAVDAFLNDKIDFTDIPHLIETTMRSHQVISKPSLNDILQADLWARQEATRNLISSVSR